MSSPLIDSPRSRMVVEFLPFGDFDPAHLDLSQRFSGPAYNCIKFTNVSGRSPSHAICVISVDQFRDEDKPSVCMIPGNGFSRIRNECIARVTALYTDPDTGDQTTEVIFCGYVTRIRQDIGKDIATVVLHDFRHKLAALPMIGQFFCTTDPDDPTQNKTYFLSGVHSEINPNSGVDHNPEPNCILSSEYFDESGQIPMFCTPNFGVQYNNSSQSPIGTEPHTFTACWWTPQLFWRHLRWRFTAQEAFDLATNEPRPFILPQIPKNLTWPAGLEDILESSYRLPTYNITSLRKCVTHDFNTMDLNAMLDMLCKMYAIYGIQIDYTSAFQGTLNIVRTRTDDQQDTGVDIVRYVGGTPSDQDEPGIVDGEFTTDSSNTYSQILLSGSNVVVEVVVALAQVWTTTDYQKWYNDLSNNFTPGKIAQILPEVNKYNSHVFCAYRADPSDDIQINTLSQVSGLTEEGAPFADRGRAPLKKLISSELPQRDTLQDTSLVERTSFNFPIYFQRDLNFNSVNYPDGTEDPEWETIALNDSMTIDPVDGTIYLDGLRSNNTTFSPSFATGGLASAYVPYAMQAVLALPLDHCLTSFKMLTCDSIPPANWTAQMAAAVGGVIANNLDTGLLANSVNRVFYSDMGTDGEPGKGLYSCNLANESVPDPTRPSVLSGAVLDDTPYINAQSFVRADDMTRLQRDGFFIYPSILPDWAPGTLINNLVTIYADGSNKSYRVNSIVQGVEFTTGKAESTKLLLGKTG